MEAILNWGVEVCLWMQQFSPALDVPFQAITFLGEEAFFLLLLSALYWCVDRRLGARLTILLLLSNYTNSVAKVLAAQPRPFEYDPRVQRISEAWGGGFPSGHTQQSVVVWGYIAACVRRTWVWVGAIVLIFLIPLSRIYLGVHFPTDVLGGYVLGLVILMAFLGLEPGVEEILDRLALGWQLATAVSLALVLLLLFPTEDGVTTSAMIAGMGCGFALERRWLGFEPGGRGWRLVLRFLVGAVVLFGLWMGLRWAFVGLEPALLLRFVRYGLVALWGSLGAPWVFMKLGLVDRLESTAAPAV